MELISVYLSRILGNKVISENGDYIGKLCDLAVDKSSQNPKVVAAMIKNKDGVKYLNWNSFHINEKYGQYVLTCKTIKEISVDTLFFIKKYVFDKQIIDVNGRKVVRVNDIRLVLLSNGFYIAAVDIGFEGVLRRLNFAKPLKKLGIKIPSKLMLWNDVETVFNSKDILLSKTYNKLDTLHPSDLADIIEDFDSKTGMIIFSSFNDSKAADVLEELEEDAQVSVIENLTTDKAADILENMPADEVADILDGMDKDKAEELLTNMEKDASDEVRELLKYDEEIIGSLMNTDYLAFSSDVTVKMVIDQLKKLKPEEHESYYIYAVDSSERLIGTVSLSSLIISEQNLKLCDIMDKTFYYMYDTDYIEDMYEVISKYNLIAIPILNKSKKIVGNVIITDVIDELIKIAKI